MPNPLRPIPQGEESIDFVICDNTVNRYGWRLLVEGIDTTNFLKNPVCVYMHDTDSIPVGKWSDLRVENERLLGKLTFDANDEDAVKLYWKYKDGYMSAVSLNIMPLAESEAPEHLLAGQKYATVIHSELLEVSTVVVPGQGNAVRLSYADGREYKLQLALKTTEEMSKEKTVAELAAENEGLRKLNADGLVALHKMRGVVTDPEIPMLAKLALGDYDNVRQMLEARVPVTPVTGGSNDHTALAKQLVKLHFDRGAITAPEMGFFETCAVSDYEATKKILDMRKGKDAIGNFGVGGNATEADERKSWTFLDFYKKDMSALADIERNEPDRYKKLLADADLEAKKMNLVI